MGSGFHWLAVVFLATGLYGQQSGRGKTTIWATYDPLRPGSAVASPVSKPSFWTRMWPWRERPTPPRKAPPRPPAYRRGPDEPGFYRKHTAIPLDEYIQRKDALRAQAPPFTAPPGLDTVIYTPPRRAPGDIPTALADTPTLTFEGIEQTELSPPDPDFAAGPEDLIAVVNSRLARYSRTGTQLQLTTLYAWFESLIPTVCPNVSRACTIFDPTVRYDSLHGRFLVSAMSEDPSTLKTYYLLSVSNGATFTGGWKHWALEGSRNGTTQTFLEIDFPQVGYDNVAVYLTADVFNVGVNTLLYSKIRILKKSELYNPATTTLTFQDIWDLKNEDGSTALTLRPAIVRGATGVSTPGVLMNASMKANADYLTLWRIQNPTGAAPTASRTTLKRVLNYDLPARFPHLGSPLLLDSGDTRILRLVQRNGILYTARPTGYATIPTTVTYDRIALATNTVTLQQRLSNGNFFYPAFDVPASHSPEGGIPNKLIAGSSTDSRGALTYVGIPQVKAGQAPFEYSTLRWGDYFGAAIDPIQGGLWVYGEYAATRGPSPGRWGTTAAYFPITTTAQFADVLPASPYFDFVNVIKLWSITTGCTATNYCPTANVTRGQMAVFVIRSIFGDDFTFSNTSSFNDVPASHPFFKYIQKLKELGITTGCTTTTFCPDSNVTRGEMAVFLVRGKLGGLHQDNFPFPQTAYFTDVPTTHGFFKFIQKLRELGITTGCTATSYCPGNPITREQMAVFLARGFLN